MNRSAIAFAPCAFDLAAAADGAGNQLTLQLLPAGDFRPRDGRELEPGKWHIDADSAARVIERFRERRNAPVLDYEHQTLNTLDNGQPAPAAGWIRDLEWREGQGLFATVELTDKAAAYIRAGEYRYVSPVFEYNARSGEILAIEMAAITNHPALDGMQPLALRAAAKFFSTSNEDHSMKTLMQLIAGTLGLAEDATENEALAALTAHFDRTAEDAGAVREALALDGDADRGAVIAACTALTNKASTASPDPEKYVAVATFEGVKRELAALTTQVRTRDVDELVTSGLTDGKLLANQESWARELGNKDVAALKAYLAATTPIAALTTTQTKGNAPAGSDDKTQLSDDELAVCSATGIDPKDFAAAKAA